MRLSGYRIPAWLSLYSVLLITLTALCGSLAHAQTADQTSLIGPGIQVEASSPSSSELLPLDLVQRSQYGTYDKAIVRTIDEKTYRTDSGAKKAYVYHVEILSGSFRGSWQTITVDASTMPWGFDPNVGDKVIVFEQAGVSQTSPTFFIDNYDRQDIYLWVGLLILICLILIAGTKGLKIAAAIAVAYLLTLELGLFPFLKRWPDLMIVCLFLLAYGLATSLSLSGWNKKSVVATLGTLLGGLVTYGLLAWFIDWGHLGILENMSAFELFRNNPNLDAGSLLTIGLVVASAALINHFALVMVSDIDKVKQIMTSLGFKELFKAAMTIGRENLASALPILVMVYLGLALPLLAQTYWHLYPWLEFANQEAVAQALLLPMGATLGLLLSIPLNSLLVAAAYSRYIRVIDPLKRATAWRPNEAEQDGGTTNS